MNTLLPRTIKFIVISLFMLVLSSCSSPEITETQAVVDESKSDGATKSEPQLCQQKEEAEERFYYTIVDPDTKVEMIWKVDFVPWWVRATPDGRILAITRNGDSIYELKPDSSIEVFFTCPGIVIETIAAATDGSVWFGSRDEERIYRLNPDGTVEIMKRAFGRQNLEAGPDGSVYAMNKGLSKFDKFGNSEEITPMISGRQFTIGPNGEIAANSGGDIVLISETGEITTLVEGYGPEAWPRFSPDGSLYIIQWAGIDVIDIQTGEVEEIDWLRNQGKAGDGTFTSDGRLILYHPIAEVYEVDLENKVIELTHHVRGNSWAMAVTPTGSVYIAYGDEQANGETVVYQVMDSNTLGPVVTIPYGLERGMTFDNNGMGYIAVGDAENGSAVIRFDPGSGEFAEYRKASCHPSTIATNPITNLPWWDECDQFYSLDEDGNLVSIPGVQGMRNPKLAITPDGEFYAIIFFERENLTLPFEHRLYRFNASDSSWEEVADLTQNNPELTLSTLVSCPDGQIYTVESLDEFNVPSGRRTMNAVRRLEPDGSMTLLGFDFSFDGLAADCDPTSGRIIFTSGIGLFALTPP